MPLQTVALNNGVDGIVAPIGFASLHATDPGGTGAAELSGGGYARQAIVWTTASNGSRSANATLSFSTTASTAVTYAGLWTLVTAGVWHGGNALTGDQAANAAGEYDVTDLTVSVAAA